MNPRIKDRFDLTLECIRRFYLREPSPLAEVLDRYADFLTLFVDFRGYVNFFLLNDIVSDDYSSIRFSLPFDGFASSSLPANHDEYEVYRTAKHEVHRRTWATDSDHRGGMTGAAHSPISGSKPPLT